MVQVLSDIQVAKSWRELTAKSDLIGIGVEPEYQRRGVGSMLMRCMLEQAAAERQKFYLVATEDGKPLYEAFGFEMLGAFDLSGIPHYSMLWIPPNVAN